MRRSRVVLAVAAAVLMVVGLSGCIESEVAAPTGTAPLRYRDEVFSSATETSNITYGAANDLQGNNVDLKLDLYQPTGDTAAKRPGIVWVHGGGFVGGDKADNGGEATALVKRGFVVVSINYRLLAPNGCSGGTAAGLECQIAAVAGIHDGQAAVRWLRANAATYRIDPDRIGITGFSAGGVISTGVGAMWDQPGDSGNPDHSSRVSGWVSLSGGLPDGQFVDGTDSPGYLFSGTADPTVPYQWSVDTANNLDAGGVYTVLHTTQGGKHQLPDRTLLVTQTSNFFYRTMKLAELAAA